MSRKTANDPVKDSIRPALRGDLRDVATWALESLARTYGLTEAEVTRVAAAIATMAMVDMPRRPGRPPETRSGHHLRHYAILARLESGASQKEVAKEFGVTKAAVSFVKRTAEREALR